jgi:hypothetical protein
MKVVGGVVGVVSGLTLLGSGCGGSNPVTAPIISTATTIHAATSTSTTSMTATPTPAVPAPSSVPSTVAQAGTVGVPNCTSADFAASFHEGNGASGVIYYEVDNINTSDVTCRTGGYFGVSVYSVLGQFISASDERTMLGANPPSSLSVAPGTTVNFEVGLASSPEGHGTCQSVGALHLIAPNDTAHLQVDTLSPSGGYAIMCGTLILVGSVRSGVATVP